MKTSKTDATEKMTTLSECLNNAIKDGYVENFKVGGNRLMTEDEKKHFTPSEVGIPNFYRFEGYSDPDDNAILYLIETTDGTLGTIIDSYGREANPDIANFIRDVQDISKEEAETPE